MRWVMTCVVAAMAVLLFVQSYSTIGAEKQAAGPPIHISELNERPVIGKLGVPLGEIVTVEGMVADDRFQRLRDDVGKTLLRVQTVNGRQFDEERVITFRPVPHSDVGVPKAGDRFSYLGYESGGFSGVPNGTFKHMPAFATTGFSFKTSFVAIRPEPLGQ